MKKLLISTLVVAMVLGFGSLAFAAAGTIAGPAFTDIAGHEAESDLTLLAALGVFTGDSGVGGTVRPDASITRAEFCKVVVTATGKGSTAAGLAGLKPTFKDEIPAWAWGYVNCATYMGVIKGYADGTFGPSSNVTYGEAVTMLIRAISGHDAQVPPGVWPYNYLFYGVDAGFTGAVDVGFANLPATRGDIARMLVATMQVNKLNKDGVAIPESSLLFPKLVEGVFSTFTLGDSASITLSPGGLLPLAEKVYIAGASSYPGLLGLNVWAAKNADGNVVAILVKQAANSVKGVFSAYADEDTTIAGIDTYVLADGTKVPIAFAGTPLVPATKVTVNGAGEAIEDLAKLAPGDECTFTLGSDGKASNVSALRFDLGKGYISNPITKSTATADTQIVTSLLAGTLNVPKTATISMNGGSLDRDSLAQWDVIQVASKLGTGSYAADTNPVYAIRGARQSFEGTVKSYRTVTAGGTTTYYTTFELADKSTKEYVVAVGGTGGNITAALTSGTGRFGLDAKGKVYVRISYETDTPYVLVTAMATGGSGATLTRTMTVDVRGAERTYNSVYSDTGCVGWLGKITINPDTNEVTGFDGWTPGGTGYEIVAVDPTNGNVTLKDNLSNVVFIQGAVVYKYDRSDDTYTYVPADQVGLWKTGGTAPNDTYVYIQGGASPFIVYSVP